MDQRTARRVAKAVVGSDLVRGYDIDPPEGVDYDDWSRVQQAFKEVGERLLQEAGVPDAYGSPGECLAAVLASRRTRR